MRGILICFFIVFLSKSYAQTGILEGKVVDAQTGAAIIGASIKIEGTQNGVATDKDGFYKLTLKCNQTVTLICSYVGTQIKIDSIIVLCNQVKIQDVAFTKNIVTEKAVIIKAATSKKETSAALITFQKNTSAVASVISQEVIKRSPDRNTGEVIKRMPGASIQEGKFIIVRGLADRYNQAMLNGILLTSTEPDRKTFSFDLIPATMIDNIIVNKTFTPELPGEWAGGLIQVNTKDVPSKSFFNIQLSTGFNTQTINRTFLQDAAERLSWLGFNNGQQNLPNTYTTKGNFDVSPNNAKTAIGQQLSNQWVSTALAAAPINYGIQLNGGTTTNLFKKVVGFNFSLSYNKNYQFLDLLNQQNKVAGNIVTTESSFNDDKYRQQAVLGALVSATLKLNNKNSVGVKTVLNINGQSSVTERSGIDISRADQYLKGTELGFKQNIFYTTQVNGDHVLNNQLRFKWYGAFNILDGQQPDQRRILYERTNNNDAFRAIISNSLSQQSGSRIYQDLSDYIYTTGGDLNYSFNAFKLKQNLKVGYMLQIKDRLFDAKLFANYLPIDNLVLRQLPADIIFDPANFGDGLNNKFAFDAIKGKTFRYMANTILNATFIQLDNYLTEKLRVVWGGRLEHFDQLVGSVNKTDLRHSYTVVTDFLPGISATYKANSKTNYRFSVSQTVIRPELRELSFLNLYDFELNASVQGNPALLRTKVTNVDARYELYPRAGETFSFAAFYKHFDNPIEQLFNEGAGGSSTFTYQNPKRAISTGVEVEFRKKLTESQAFRNFTIQANASYIYSRITDKKFNVNRQLQGQSPYVVNLGILYDVEKLGLTATLLFNQIGNRIYLVGDISAGAGSPDIYEAARPLLDFQISKKVAKNKGELRLSVSDILNQRQYFYQNIDQNKGLKKGIDVYRFTRQFGTSINLTFNYTIK
jgi:TonB-dependent receptor